MRPSPNGKPSALHAGRPPWLPVPDDNDKRPPTREVHLRREQVAKDLKVVIAGRAWETITQQLALADGRLETGGVLLGLRQGFRELLITDAGVPGPRARRRRASFRHDSSHDIQFAKELGRWAGVSELGSWHSHPSSTESPSERDLQAWVAVAELIAEDMPLPRYIGLIATARNGDWRKPKLNGWITKLGDREAKTPWYIVERIQVERASYG